MLYHLSFDVLDTIEEFIPRVPKSRMKKENKTIKRVCCADTLEGAITAMPNNSGFIMSDEIFPLIKVYELDETKIEKDKLFTPGEISDKVPDAIATGEHWITTNIKPNNIYTIQITSLKYDKDLKTISDLNYRKITEVEENSISDYYSFNIRVKFSEETLRILDEETVDDDEIYDIEDVLSKANNTIEQIIYSISTSTEPSFRSTDIDDGFEIYVDGYFQGEYLDRAFIYQESEVIKKLKEEFKYLIFNYKISLEFI